jgi:hypothetical protein
MKKTIKPSTAAAPMVPLEIRMQTLTKQLSLDTQLFEALDGAPGKDKVQLTITRFRNVLHKTKSKSGREFLRMSLHTVSVNGHKAVPPNDPSLEAQFSKTVPKTVEITVVDGQKTHHTYYPIGVAFKNGPQPIRIKKRVFPSDFTNGRVYLFGEKMYLTLDKDFDFKHLSKYAVIVQRDDTQIGVIDPPVINEC